MRRLFGIIAVFIVAILFYASVWTSENSTSTCFFWSGVVLILQAGATAAVVVTTEKD